MILADLNHLLADVVLGAAGYRRARPPERREKRGLHRPTPSHGFVQHPVQEEKPLLPSPGFVLFEVSAGLDVAGQLDLHVPKQRDHLELLPTQAQSRVNVTCHRKKEIGDRDGSNGPNNKSPMNR